jgi:uncharacterized protein YndB with AHSA1/START domain
VTSVRIQRTIPASPATVYRAWLDPELLRRWAAPVGWEAVHVEVDERVGGHYRCRHVDAQGLEVGGFDCEILDLVPNERIVLRWQFLGLDRRPLAEASTRLTITLRPVPPDSCELTLIHDRLSPGVTDAIRRGWTGTMVRLEQAVRTP